MDNGYGAVQVFDPRTGDKKWEFIRRDAWIASGVLTTGSGLLFAGTTGDTYSGPVAARLADGYFYAPESRTGQPLWQMSLAGNVSSAPMIYSAVGAQYVAVTAGNLLFAFAIRQ